MEIHLSITRTGTAPLSPPFCLDFGKYLCYRNGVAVALERELETFQNQLPKLLQSEGNRGKYALVHSDRVDSVWGTVDEALNAGYERFGLEPFLIKEITEDERPQYFSRNVTRCQ